MSNPHPHPHNDSSSITALPQITQSSSSNIPRSYHHRSDTITSLVKHEKFTDINSTLRSRRRSNNSNLLPTYPKFRFSDIHLIKSDKTFSASPPPLVKSSASLRSVTSATTSTSTAAVNPSHQPTQLQNPAKSTRLQRLKEPFNRAIIIINPQTLYLSSSGSQHCSNATNIIHNLSRLIPVFRKYAGDIIWVTTQYTHDQPTSKNDGADGEVSVIVSSQNLPNQLSYPPANWRLPLLSSKSRIAGPVTAPKIRNDATTLDHSIFSSPQSTPPSHVFTSPRSGAIATIRAKGNAQYTRAMDTLRKKIEQSKDVFTNPSDRPERRISLGFGELIIKRGAQKSTDSSPTTTRFTHTVPNTIGHAAASLKRNLDDSNIGSPTSPSQSRDDNQLPGSLYPPPIFPNLKFRRYGTGQEKTGESKQQNREKLTKQVERNSKGPTAEDFEKLLEKAAEGNQTSPVITKRLENTRRINKHPDINIQNRQKLAPQFPAIDCQDDELMLSRGLRSVPACLKNSPDIEIYDEIDDMICRLADKVIVTGSYSALRDSELLLLLRAKRITDLYICGSLSNVSVHATIADAVKYGFSINVIHDCLGYRTTWCHEKALGRFQHVYGAVLLSNSEIMENIYFQKPIRRKTNDWDPLTEPPIKPIIKKKNTIISDIVADSKSDKLETFTSNLSQQEHQRKIMYTDIAQTIMSDQSTLLSQENNQIINQLNSMHSITSNLSKRDRFKDLPGLKSLIRSMNLTRNAALSLLPGEVGDNRKVVHENNSDVRLLLRNAGVDEGNQEKVRQYVRALLSVESDDKYKRFVSVDLEKIRDRLSIISERSSQVVPRRTPAIAFAQLAAKAERARARQLDTVEEVRTESEKSENNSPSKVRNRLSIGSKKIYPSNKGPSSPLLDTKTTASITPISPNPQSTGLMVVNGHSPMSDSAAAPSISPRSGSPSKLDGLLNVQTNGNLMSNFHPDSACNEMMAFSEFTFGNPWGSGDSFMVYNINSTTRRVDSTEGLTQIDENVQDDYLSFSNTTYGKLFNEIRWHCNSTLGRTGCSMICCQGDFVEPDGSRPIYRNEKSYHTPSLHFSSTIARLRREAEARIGQYLNHAVIEFYLPEMDGMPERCDKTLDRVPDSSTVIFNFGSARRISLIRKSVKSEEISNHDLASSPIPPINQTSHSRRTSWSKNTLLSPGKTFSRKSINSEILASLTRASPVVTSQIKTEDSNSNGDGTQKILMTHGTMLILGPKTNREWLLRVDKSNSSDTYFDDEDYHRTRICITFRWVNTWIMFKIERVLSSSKSANEKPDAVKVTKNDDGEGRQHELSIWGQGAASKFRHAPLSVIENNITALAMMRDAMAQEDKMGKGQWDWQSAYGGGFDVLAYPLTGEDKIILYKGKYRCAGEAVFFSGTNSNIRVRAGKLKEVREVRQLLGYLHTVGKEVLLHEMPDIPYRELEEILDNGGVSQPILLRDINPTRTEVTGVHTCLLYLREFYPLPKGNNERQDDLAKSLPNMRSANLLSAMKLIKNLENALDRALAESMSGKLDIRKTRADSPHYCEAGEGEDSNKDNISEGDQHLLETLEALDGFLAEIYEFPERQFDFAKQVDSVGAKRTAKFGEARKRAQKSERFSGLLPEDLLTYDQNSPSSTAAPPILAAAIRTKQPLEKISDNTSKTGNLSRRHIIGCGSNALSVADFALAPIILDITNHWSHHWTTVQRYSKGIPPYLSGRWKHIDNWLLDVSLWLHEEWWPYH